jgi:thiosulfate/3-mercaptopyruvate sulfurtransferase
VIAGPRRFGPRVWAPWPSVLRNPITGDDPKTLVSTDWLAAHLNDPDLRVIDASYYLPDMGRDARPNTTPPYPRRALLRHRRDRRPRSELPHMAAPVEKFMSRMRAMGVGRRPPGGGL